LDILNVKIIIETGLLEQENIFPEVKTLGFLLPA